MYVLIKVIGGYYVFSITLSCSLTLKLTFFFSTDSLVNPTILPSPSPLVLGLQVS